MSRIYRRDKDEYLVDAFIDPGDLLAIYGLNDKDIPLVCPLRDKQPPNGADYIIFDKDGWWYAHDKGLHKPFHVKDLYRMSTPLPHLDIWKK